MWMNAQSWFPSTDTVLRRSRFVRTLIVWHCQWHSSCHSAYLNLASHPDSRSSSQVTLYLFKGDCCKNFRLLMWDGVKKNGSLRVFSPTQKIESEFFSPEREKINPLLEKQGQASVKVWTLEGFQPLRRNRCSQPGRKKLHTGRFFKMKKKKLKLCTGARE